MRLLSKSLITWIISALIISFGITACTVPPPESLPNEVSWADSVHAQMTLEEKVAQMMMVDVPPLGDITSPSDRNRLNRHILNGKAGGVLLFAGHPLHYAPWIEWVQHQGSVPLLVGLDAEWGPGFRLKEMTRFPNAMALAATSNTGIAFETGAETARQARSVGVSVLFAPVADVQTNPTNPVIGTRAWSDDPDSVSAYTRSFVRGVRSSGLLPVAKHFPGHGDTSRDSHTSLPLSTRSNTELFGTDLVPFADLIADSLEGIMSAHIVSKGHSFEDDGPATLSHRILTELARDSLHFSGLMFSDALNMVGVTSTGSNGEVAIQAVMAGIDVLLMPPDPQTAVDAIIGAIRDGVIAEARIDSSVHRILRAKQSLGLQLKTAHTNLSEILEITSSEESRQMAHFIGRKAVTVLKDETVLPLSGSSDGVLLITADFRSYTSGNRDPSKQLEGFISDRNDGNVTHIQVNPRNWILSMPEIFKETDRHRAVIFADFVGITPVFGWDRLRFLGDVTRSQYPVIVLEHASPYIAPETPPSVAAHILGYDSSPGMLEAVSDVLFGLSAVNGRLPIHLSDEYPRGYGLKLPQYVASLAPAEDADMDPFIFERMDRLVQKAIADSAFPGAALAVGRGAQIVKRADYGFHTFDSSRELESTDIFDLASLTKVIATTTAIMQLYEHDLIDLHRPVADYLPEFGQNGKGGVTIWHLLTHTGGLIPFRPFYREGVTSAREVRNRILQDSLIYEPGSMSRYSDFGPITLAWMVERITGETFSEYVYDNVFKPLSMYDTGFKSVRRGAIQKAVPTERDDYFRYRLLQGEVHDETAYLLGGTAGHAGLFSTADDLSRFAAMLINEGRVGDRVFLKPETIRYFVGKVDPDLTHTRALGWDTRSLAGYSSAGSHLGPWSYGHTGFTGTSFWIDPDSKLFVILLTNRVYPTRDNRGHIPVRPAVADLSFRAFQPQVNSAVALTE
ncbi:MAG: serine hydrolase [Bacteroidetes Order II. Incertae sedis bacterium]|nr:serine hydrolase [Bacteroidetes Order II. bacterium]MBT4602014.1 serine hydrolase [Bacteroidetes Order II. bacterium]MBT5250358.1 serine hydrolase [Bacteroidetes Order II. bacterium]MBT6424733.1 serine hydrolase [Bacteroidetes Order II. bacterium]MBT6599212.1 serine hydrolase [Bacteroidetes Order II. bacterium]